MTAVPINAIFWRSKRSPSAFPPCGTLILRNGSLSPVRLFKVSQAKLDDATRSTHLDWLICRLVASSTMQSAGSAIPESKIRISPGTRAFSSMVTSSDLMPLRRRRTRTSVVMPDCNLRAATELRYSCQNRTTQEMMIMKSNRMKVLQVGGGVDTAMMARRASKTLNGFGMMIKRSCHHVGGFLVERRFFPLR